MEYLGLFPFGQPVRRVFQQDPSEKPVFVLGVYASAIHAIWKDNNGNKRINALAVASEPYIFWQGEHPESIISQINIPEELGNLSPAAPGFNGSSGRALDDFILNPLGIDRRKTWLCDLVPYSCVNPAQMAAIRREYYPQAAKYKLPFPSVPYLPHPLINEERRRDIIEEIQKAKAEYLILLGDQPIKWFLSIYDPKRRINLSSFVFDGYSYGECIDMRIGGHIMRILPLAHPRQIARLGKSSIRWYKIHQDWIKNVFPLGF